MIELLAIAALLLPQQQGADFDAAVDPQRVEQAVAELRDASDEPEAADRVQAIRTASGVPHSKVIDEISKALKDQEMEVQQAALEALRRMPHPKALEELHKTYRTNKKMVKDEVLCAQLLKSIGQHGSPTSIDVLADNPFGTPTHDSIRARILGLGNIRDPRSIEALVGLMRKTGPAKLAPYMDYFRLSLVMLTGVDQGKSAELWQKWWREHEKDFVLAPEPPRLPDQLQGTWDYYWGIDGPRERNTKRERRGRGDEGEPGR